MSILEVFKRYVDQWRNQRVDRSLLGGHFCKIGGNKRGKERGRGKGKARKREKYRKGKEGKKKEEIQCKREKGKIS